MMNTTPTPAYLVCHTHKSDQTTRIFFTHENLLNARRAAYTFVESLFNTRLEDYVNDDETDVYLVEIAEPDDPAPVIKARVMHKPNMNADGEESRKESELKLLELHREFAYYHTHQHSIGFGAFGIWVNRKTKPNTPQALTILCEAVGAVMAEISSCDSAWHMDFTFAYYEPDVPIKLVPLPC